MRRFNEQNYYIRSVNTHLVNLLDENYYIELGVVDMNILSRLILGERLDMSELIYDDLLTSGIGKISKDASHEVDYQLHYLLNLRQKSSTNKFFLTTGTIVYLDNFGCEKYAPIVLIPIEIDYITKSIVASGAPISNIKLIKKLAIETKNNKEDQDKFEEMYTNVSLNSVGQIDNFMVSLANEANCSYSPTCYLTVCDVEYRDFVVGDDFFVTERSLYETTDLEITKVYFEKTHSILPTNIDQKYIILKAMQGESFGVDGRLGSGKTHTILNIIANAIRDNKKVLYVNQDLDNILDVEKNFKCLGLDNFIFNLSKSIREVDVPTMAELSTKNLSFTQDELKLISDFQEELDERIDGYVVRYILEKLAIIENSHLELIDINIEKNLEKYEVEMVYSELLKTEAAFKVVENYEANIWKNLSIAHNNITVSEIIEHTNKIFESQLKINKEINSFCKKFEIKLPKDINDLSKLISHIMNFGVTRPLPSWKNAKVRSNVVTALGEIQLLSDENYNATKYYERFVSDNYIPGRAKEILNELCGSTIKLENESDDNTYLNNLLSNESRLQSLIDKISLNEEGFKKFDIRIDEEFGIKDFHKGLNDDYLDLFFKLYEYTNNYYTLNFWADSFSNQNEEFLKNGKKINELVRKTQEIKELFQPFLLNGINISFNELSQIISSKLANKIIKRLLDPKKLKNNHLNSQELVNLIRNYYEVIKEAVPIVVDTSYANAKDVEDLMHNYDGLYILATKLNKNQIEILKHIFKKQASTTKLDFKNLKECLELLVVESGKSDEITSKLANFNIHIDGNYQYQKRKSIISYVPYLNRVIELKNELSQIFKGRKSLSSFDILDLVKIDEEYLTVQETVAKNESRYKSLLGVNYKGFDTIINEVGQTLEHFDELISRLELGADISSLFQEPTLSRFIENAIKLNNTWSEWITNFRAFSFCFKGGKNILQTNTFKENIEMLTAYVQSVHQIESILQINATIKMCSHYGLNKLAKIVQKSSSATLLAESFIYAILKSKYDTIKETYPTVLKFDDYEKAVDNFYEYELDCCARNIIYLKSFEEKKTKSKVINIPFNDFEKIIDTTIKNTSIFLADLSILNTNVKLDRFDLVIVDDGHLSTSRKYHRINECRQCIIFGDKLFQNSSMDTLMQRIKNSPIITLRKRYIKMTPKFNNIWNINNCYIYNANAKIYKQMVNSIKDLAFNVINLFNKNEEHVINVIVGDETTRREVYEAFVSLLEEDFSSDEIIQILGYNIRIINGNNEGAKYVNDVVIYYNDFAAAEPSVKERIFKNFIVASNNIYMYYVGTRIEDENNQMLKTINAIIGKSERYSKTIKGVTLQMAEKLKANGLKPVEGFGCFDLLIEEKTPLGIMIIGTSNNESYSLMDDYRYYYHEYLKNGWNVLVFYVGDLINNLDQAIEKVIKTVKGDKNEKK